MSDDYQGLDSPPRLGITKHLPHALTDCARKSLRDLVAKCHQENEWANRLHLAMEDAEYWRRSSEVSQLLFEAAEGGAEKHNAERDAKIAELESRIASHVCAGPTTINLTENAAVQEFTAELRRELAEERNHVRQHKATIDSHVATIEKLRRELFECESTMRAQDEAISKLQDRICQAQQEAAKSPAPDVVRLQQDLQASETARANAENRIAQLQQFADKPLFDQFERFCNRIIDACRQGTSSGLISDMAEQALKDMGAPPF